MQRRNSDKCGKLFQSIQLMLPTLHTHNIKFKSSSPRMQQFALVGCRKYEACEPLHLWYRNEVEWHLNATFALVSRSIISFVDRLFGLFISAFICGAAICPTFSKCVR